MQHWLEDYPALRVLSKTIAADDYNRIRLGLCNKSLPWRLSLQQFKCLYCLLDQSAWICIDECQNDLPILAWTNFKLNQRSSLQQPVGCELRLYHMHAGLIMGRALDAIQETVEKLQKKPINSKQSISRLKF